MMQHGRAREGEVSHANPDVRARTRDAGAEHASAATHAAPAPGAGASEAPVCLSTHTADWRAFVLTADSRCDRAHAETSASHTIEGETV